MTSAETADQKPVTFHVPLEVVTGLLFKAAELAAYREHGVFDDAVVFVPPYLADLADIGQRQVDKLSGLPTSHPHRKGYDPVKLQVLRDGVDAIRSDHVVVDVDPKQPPIPSGTYRVIITVPLKA